MSDGYTNRTDLVGDPSRGAGNMPADTQGQKAAKAEQQSALPMPRPAHMADITGPSTRPAEPVQAGLPMGPGPSGQGLPSRSAATLDTYRALLRRTRDPRLAILIGRMQERNR